jgi:hypothetical protein
MNSLKELSDFIDRGTRIVAIESPIIERLSLLHFVEQIAQERQIPWFFFNPGYNSLQSGSFTQAGCQFNPVPNTNDTEIFEFLLTSDLEGIIFLEGFGSVESNRVHQLINAYYTLPLKKSKQYWLLIDDAIDLPSKLLGLIPVLINPLPTAKEVTEILERWGYSDRLTLARACLGLYRGEIELLRQRLNGKSLPEALADITEYKTAFLKGKGLEMISSPDVLAVGGLDLLEKTLERAAAYGLSFPKGIILWGPPGTGKSLSAKLAAQKMGVPLIAADWGGLISSVAGESEANLRYLLQMVEVSSPCILYWDDFDKAFAGWDSDASGGVQRRLTGKFLTWMQERTAPVYVMATVNRLEMLPPELIRRFDDIFFVDLPHAGARKEIFDLHLAKYFGEVNLTEQQWRRLLREYNHCTPAEIGVAVRKTAESAFCSGRPGQVTLEDLLKERSLFTPATIRESEAILAIRNRATYARPAASADTSRWAIPPQELFG